ncbi:MAG TPA: hypothetical protein DCQ31_15410 [Bacteroidales bacterium]|nr:hypothetical protein [Bacteroidales bacterium]
MIHIIRKYSAFVLSGTFSVILAACYGTPMDMQSQKRITVFDPENKPIEGLALTLKLHGETQFESKSDSNGDIYLNLNSDDSVSSYDVLIADIDGEANGGEFIPKELKLNEQRELQVTLERK